MTKEEIQQKVYKDLRDEPNIVLKWATGIGKSKETIDIINYKINKAKKKLSVLLVVAETAHKDNWQKEFNKWKLSDCNLTIECYASLKNYKQTNWDIIIFDEAHHLFSDIRLSIIENIKASNVIVLSATLKDIYIDTLCELYGSFKVSSVSLQYAIENNILPKPKVFLIPLELDNKIPNIEIKESWGNKEKQVELTCEFLKRYHFRNRKKYPSAKLTIKCTQQQAYNIINKDYEYYRLQYLKMRKEYFKNLWLQEGSKRKRLLGSCKTDDVKLLINKLEKENKRFVCFCTNIEQAETFNSENCIHSQKQNSLQTIDDFNNNKINSLYAIGMIQEGQNLNNIQTGIIVQLDNAERAFIQKFGRTLRSDSPEQYIFYYKNTRDEEFLNNCLENVNMDYVVTIDNYKDFINGKTCY